jgi:uncharacterized protein involved in tellurium resistance
MRQLKFKDNSKDFYKEMTNTGLLRNSPYLIIKESFFKRLIRGLYYKFVDELYCPYDKTDLSVTYEAGNKRGIRIHKKGKGNQEAYFTMPEDLLK